jgi:flagellin-like hook-associated protein FlgL
VNAFTEGISVAQTTNLERFFDNNGHVWAQAFTEAPGGPRNRLSIDYAALEVEVGPEIEEIVSDGGLKFQVGANKDETIEVTLQGAGTAALGIANLSVATRAQAETAIGRVDAAITRVNGHRAEIGAMSNRFEKTHDFLGVQYENQEASRSRIRDLDFADEIVGFTKNQILQQAGVSALAQANVAPQSILQLLQ